MTWIAYLIAFLWGAWLGGLCFYVGTEYGRGQERDRRGLGSGGGR
jgi:hypothetical protein